MFKAIENADVIEAGMNAWNTLTELFGEKGESFEHPEDFRQFYTEMCERLFEEEVSE